MRKNVSGRQFKRDTNERKALLKNLASSLILEERVKTTLAKAKEIRPYTEKLITKAKDGSLKAKQEIHPYLTKEALEKILSDVGPRNKDRNGGYTRIVHAGYRVADSAEIAVIELVEKKKIELKPKDKKKTKKVKKEKVVKSKDKKPVKKEVKKDTKETKKTKK